MRIHTNLRHLWGKPDHHIGRVTVPVDSLGNFDIDDATGAFLVANFHGQYIDATDVAPAALPMDMQARGTAFEGPYMAPVRAPRPTPVLVDSIGREIRPQGAAVDAARSLHEQFPQLQKAAPMAPQAVQRTPPAPPRIAPQGAQPGHVVTGEEGLRGRLEQMAPDVLRAEAREAGISVPDASSPAELIQAIVTHAHARAAQG